MHFLFRKCEIKNDFFLAGLTEYNPAGMFPAGLIPVLLLSGFRRPAECRRYCRFRRRNRRRYCLSCRHSPNGGGILTLLANNVRIVSLGHSFPFQRATIAMNSRAIIGMRITGNPRPPARILLSGPGE